MVDINLVKLMANVAITSSTSMVVRNVIRANVLPATPLQSAQVWIGSFAIGGAVAERCWERTDAQIDRGLALYKRWQAGNLEVVR